MDPERTVPATPAESGFGGEAATPADVPRKLGRYTVLERLGAGASGVVFAAYDPQLDRRVAVKLLKWHGSGRGQQRLLDEARALAKLSHPNVVAVHDVGTLDDQAFVAMAFIDGPTLRQWARSETQRAPEAWRRRLRVMIDAGRGLAAAHAAGLIHRDFKPDNVLVDRHDGRPRVADFGLALSQRDTAGLDEGRPRSSTDDVEATAGLAGTPVYMAPELLDGAAADVLSDQFGYCVTLYEVLYGHRPYGDTLTEIVANVAAGEIADEPAGTTVPTWVRQAVLRGLSRRPAERWPSMDALLDALDEDPQRRRRLRWRIAGAGIGVAGVSAAIAVQVVPATDAPRCDDAAEQLATAWTPARRTAAVDGMLATNARYAASTSERIAARLDEYAARWRASYVDACSAHARGEQSGELLDLRMACLAGGRDELRAVVDAFTAADLELLERADRIVGELRELGQCDDLEMLRQRAPLPRDPARRSEVERIAAELSELSVAEAIGRGSDLVARADEQWRAAAATEYLPLMLRAKLVQGRLYAEDAPAGDAHEQLTAAWNLALQLDDDDAAAEAALLEVEVLGFQLRHYDAADVRAADAAAAIERIGAHDPESAHALRQDLLVVRASVELRKPGSGDAEALVAPAIETLRREGGDELYLTQLLGIRGWAAQARGDFEAARAAYAESLQLVTSRLGADHPQTAIQHNNVGLMLKNLERHPEAITHFERALEIMSALAPDEDPQLSMILRNLGNTYLADEQDARAVHYLDRAFSGLPPDETPKLGAQLGHIWYARALERLGRAEEGAARYEQALRMAEDEERDNRLAEFFARLSASESRLGHHDRAVEIGERGLAALRELPDPDPVHQADIAFALARALKARGGEGDRDRAHGLAAEARARYDAAGQVERASEVAAFTGTLDAGGT